MLATMIIVKVNKCKLGPFQHAVNISKWPSGSIYIGNIFFYLIFLPIYFPRCLEIDLERSITFLTLILLIHIDKFYLFHH